MNEASSFHSTVLLLGLQSISTLNSYLSFIWLHNFPVNPSPETLSFFTVYMSHHINPCSVASYLSGISQQLEPYFPSWTLKGCMRLKGISTNCRCALTIPDLDCVISALQTSSHHNNSLFLSILLMGFFTLLRLGEMISKCSSVIITSDHYKFQLPSHKADHFFEGNRILIRSKQFPTINPLFFFQRYLNSWDSLFPLASPLWLISAGTIPNHRFFMTRIKSFFKDNIRGHSM
ncbi:hypothetical protein BYT27DRAFT_7221419 [Phlegmacium glaucopus]|nr:hypothetical protein BYT27DRAFT_7221419 [Phlegmacium glaucopus]